MVNRATLALLLLTAALLGAAGCASSTNRQSGRIPTTSAVGIIGNTTVPASTTTTTAIPAAPQTTPDAAAQALISNWVSNDKAVALRVATPAAVATLFAQPYQGQTVINRSCTVTYPPYVCSFGTEGGGNANSSLYEIYVAKAGPGWYVSSVDIES